MHNHDTAVLDRPAEATAPAGALLSALDFPVSTSGLEPARSTKGARELATGSGAVHGREVTELAVALFASGVCPRSFRSADTAQLMQWAAQGLALLGIDRVRRYAHRTQFLHCRLYERHDPGRSAHQAEYDRMWPCSFRTIQSCHDAAWRLYWDAPATAAGVCLLLAALGQPCHTCGQPAGTPCRPGCGDITGPASQASPYPHAARSVLHG